MVSTLYLDRKKVGRQQRNIDVVPTLLQHRSINVVLQRLVNTDQSKSFPRFINVDFMTSTLFQRRESNVDPVYIFSCILTSNQRRRLSGEYVQRWIGVIIPTGLKMNDWKFA